MLVKTTSKNGEFIRIDECKTACVSTNKIGDGNSEKDVTEHILIITYQDETDATFTLPSGGSVYFMNSDGKTIDLTRIP
jgi:hypothetical protein